MNCIGQQRLLFKDVWVLNKLVVKGPLVCVSRLLKGKREGLSRELYVFYYLLYVYN